MAAIQAEIVPVQVTIAGEHRRTCLACERALASKGHYSATFRSLFGDVPIRVRRLLTRPCQEMAEARSFAAFDLEAATVAPELAYVTARYAALAPFGKVADLLSELLPICGALNAGTVRNRTTRVGEAVVQPHRLGACVDGPSDAREKMRILTGGSIAIMCPACWRGSTAAGPDGVRDPNPNTNAALKACAPNGFSGSSVLTDRHLIPAAFTPASTRVLAVLDDCRPAVARGHRDPCRLGHPVAQSRPKPRGGSIAGSSPRSKAHISPATRRL